MLLCWMITGLSSGIEFQTHHKKSLVVLYKQTVPQYSHLVLRKGQIKQLKGQITIFSGNEEDAFHQPFREMFLSVSSKNGSFLGVYIYPHPHVCMAKKNTSMDGVNKAEGVPSFSISDIKPDPIAHICVLSYSVDEGQIT